MAIERRDYLVQASRKGFDIEKIISDHSIQSFIAECGISSDEANVIIAVTKNDFARFLVNQPMYYAELTVKEKKLNFSESLKGCLRRAITFRLGNGAYHHAFYREFFNAFHKELGDNSIVVGEMPARDVVDYILFLGFEITKFLTKKNDKIEILAEALVEALNFLSEPLDNAQIEISINNIYTAMNAVKEKDMKRTITEVAVAETVPSEQAISAVKVIEEPTSAETKKGSSLDKKAQSVLNHIRKKMGHNELTFKQLIHLTQMTAHPCETIKTPEDYMAMYEKYSLPIFFGIGNLEVLPEKATSKEKVNAFRATLSKCVDFCENVSPVIKAISNSSFDKFIADVNNCFDAFIHKPDVLRLDINLVAELFDPDALQSYFAENLGVNSYRYENENVDYDTNVVITTFLTEVLIHGLTLNGESLYLASDENKKKSMKAYAVVLNGLITEEVDKLKALSASETVSNVPQPAAKIEQAAQQPKKGESIMSATATKETNMNNQDHSNDALAAAFEQLKTTQDERHQKIEVGFKDVMKLLDGVAEDQKRNDERFARNEERVLRLEHKVFNADELDILDRIRDEAKLTETKTVYVDKNSTTDNIMKYVGYGTLGSVTGLAIYKLYEHFFGSSDANV